jgi:hypothetical protein
MLAKSTNAGSSFSGVIDYFYEGKMADRGKANKQAKVVCASDNVRIPFGTNDLKTRALLKQDFINQAKLHRTYGYEENKKYVGQHILSFTEKDTRGLSQDKLKDITENYIKLAGLDKTQFVAFSHKDTNNFHVHILFNRAMNDGKKYPEWKEKKKTAERGIALSLGYKLELVGDMKKMAEAKEVTQIRAGMKDIVELSKSNELLSQAKNLHHLGKLCEHRGVQFQMDEKSVRVGEEHYTQLDLGAVFLHNRIASKEQVNDFQKCNIETQMETPERDFVIKGSFEEAQSRRPLSIAISKDENVKVMKRKKRPADYKIKIGKMEKKLSNEKNLRI